MKREYFYQQNFPIIDLELIGKERNLLVKALVDSGANISLFGAQVGEYLGIPVEKGEKLELKGIGGKIIAYLHFLPVRFNKSQFNLKIAFSREIKFPINLLGRDNFFLPFLITFNEKFQKILIEEH